ncbi:MAG: hypothetical protein DI551_06145 [Micavibrio aeruginosavorus]|uniref:Uncharacterized protein n=1 Tax=Micavibrio aeruginosavorus TaxID=349221 RepID=A0A2W5MXA4_9BACT|nr:MAG: hypothetical protein DI551_06145 [Micavibrio aeruginosavorus]
MTKLYGQRFGAINRSAQPLGLKQTLFIAAGGLAIAAQIYGLSEYNRVAKECAATENPKSEQCVRYAKIKKERDDYIVIPNIL